MGFASLVRSPGVALFALVLGAYVYFYQAGGWNQNSRFDLVRSMVETGSVVIDPYHHNTGDKSCRGPAGKCTRADARRGEHYYCDKAPGASWLAALPHAVIHALWGNKHPSPEYLAASSYAATAFAVALPGALSVVLLYAMLAVFSLSVAARIAIALAYGLGTLAFPYATLFYGHQLAAALLFIGFALAVMTRHFPEKTGAARLAAIGLVLGYAVAVEYPAALAAVPIGLYLAAFVRPWQRLAWVALGVALPAVGVALYHWIAFGGPFTLPYEFSTQKHRHMGVFMGLGAPNPTALWHILFSSYRGLFWSAPWLLLAVPGAIHWLRERRFRPEATVCLTVFVLFLWLNASLVDWQGGWAMGPRYLIPAIPFLAVLSGGVIAFAKTRPRRRVSGILLLALAGYSAFLMLAGTAVKPEVPVHIKKPFGRYILPAFYAGDLAVSTQSINSAAAPVGGPRYAWNLGQLMGLSGHASLLPLFLYLLATGAWLTRTARLPDVSGSAASKRSNP